MASILAGLAGRASDLSCCPNIPTLLYTLEVKQYSQMRPY